MSTELVSGNQDHVHPATYVNQCSFHGLQSIFRSNLIKHDRVNYLPFIYTHYNITVLTLPTEKAVSSRCPRCNYMDFDKYEVDSSRREFIK